MNKFVILCFIALVGSSLAFTAGHERGCIYALGRCVRECEEGTHSYGTACDYLTPEATCENPNPVPDTTGKICDFSACYCVPPTVRDTALNKCIPVEQCPLR